MRKLIKLLNEYEAKRHKTSVIAEIRKQKEDRLSYLEMNWNYSELLCISKGYEFIKWLVDNDKIDLEEYKNESGLYTLKVIYGTDHYIDLLTNKVNSDFLLMLLSRQNKPIEYLISILK